MDRAVLRGPRPSPVNDDGRSGATLERVLLADGSRVVVKRFDPAVDLVMRLSGDTRGREVEFVRRGILDRLPATVLHPVLDGWYDDDGRGVLVMRDLGDAVLTWKSIVTKEQARTMFGAVADLHAAFLGSAPDGLTPLDRVLGLFEPRRIRPYAGEALVDYALRGWEYWPEVAPGEVGERVLALAQDTAPLTAACLALPTTLLHGDLATVNMAFEPDRPGCLTLIDWGLAAAGPAELDIGRLLAGCAHLFGPVGRAGSETIVARLDGLVALQREVAGPAYDEPPCGSVSSPASPGWAGTRRSTSSSTPTRPFVSGNVRRCRGGCTRPSWPSRPASSERTGDGREHALPPDRRVLRRPGQRGEGGPVGRSDALHGVDRARPGQPRDLREPLDGPAHGGRDDRGGRGPVRGRRARRATRSASALAAARARSRRWPPSCPSAAPCTCPSARRRRRSTPCSWPPTTWSTAGTWPWPPAATPGWTPTSCTRSPSGSTTARRSTETRAPSPHARPLTGDAQHDLLARFGRDAAWGPHHRRWCGSTPPSAPATSTPRSPWSPTTSSSSPRRRLPTGSAHEGRDAVRAAWTEVMRTPGMSFTEEESFVSGDRAVVRWRYAWGGADTGHVRGVDVIRFRDGLVCEKLSYVKG